MFVCNEMLGLGHLRRSLALARALVESDRRATALVVTGSSAWGGMRLAPSVDILKLPTLPVSTSSAWSQTARRPTAALALATGEVRALRSHLLLTAVRSLQPELLVVDHKPIGWDGELQEALQWCRNSGACCTALGLRDVDEALVEPGPEWSGSQLAAVPTLYDLVLVYGPASGEDERVDRLRATGVPVHHTDLVGEPAAAHGPPDIRDGYLLATTGGGVDGFELLSAVVEAIRHRRIGVPAVLVTGPMMGSDQIARLRDNAVGLDARVHEFRPDMDELLGGARGVIAMAGYSTVAEILNSGKPALLVPRTFPREEQLNRARRWARAGRLEMLDPRDLDPVTLSEAIVRLLRRRCPPARPLTGASDAAMILLRAVAAVRAGPGQEAQAPSRPKLAQAAAGAEPRAARRIADATAAMSASVSVGPDGR
jgi:predicted glycosyltransferase